METAPSLQAPRVSPAAQEKLAGIVGVGNISAARSQDCICDIQPQLVVSPATEQEVAAVLRCANEAGLAVIPRGGGSKMNWGNAPAHADFILSLARMNRVLDYAWADLTVTVQAGCTVAALRDLLAGVGQRLALDALWPDRATIGGILSTNDSGALRLRFGALRDLIIGVTLALSDGTLARSGGKVVKNVAGYDLPKLATGAFGTLGVITQATFRLHPMSPHTLTLSFSAATLDELQQKILAIQDSSLAHTALQVRVAGSETPKADLLFEATDEGLSAQRVQAEKLIGALKESSPDVWNARQALWDGVEECSAILKISVLPANISKTLATVRDVAASEGAQVRAVFQATGIGWIRIDSRDQSIAADIAKLRSEIESRGGSLFVAHRPMQAPAIDAWGSIGDALPVMRALKRQLDPQNTLNPCRYVGGI
jgi:glycolate oxidase FAD binding subunit